MRNICKELPSSEYLNSILSYDPETGKLFWKDRFKGREAGTKSRKKDGSAHAIRVCIAVDGRNRAAVAHRIIWRMLGKHVPDGMVIDHEDTNPWNNKLDNLRLATWSQNISNRRRPWGKKNPELPRGIDWHPKLKKYRVQIMADGKKKHIGVYVDLEDAKAAYKLEAQKQFGEFVSA